jgi:CubicO group peptidase (beta-lactamase class C family)
MTAAVTMTLVDEGLLDLDEPVQRYLPELSDMRVLRAAGGPLSDTVPAARPITARDLLTFTFGSGMRMEMFTSREPWPIVVAANDAKLGAFGPPEPWLQPDPDTWMARFGELPLLAQPGERWLYNTGALVLGVLVRRASGQSFGDALQSRLFDPIGMRDTGFSTTDPARLATRYAPSPGGSVEVSEPVGAWTEPPKFGDGGAGLVSTVDDLYAFARMLMRSDGSVLSPDSIELMTHDQMSPEVKAIGGGMGDEFFDIRSWGFCQSVYVDGPLAGAFGWEGGLGTSWLVDPVRDVVVIVLTQLQFDSPVMPAVHVDIRDAVYATLAS